MLTIPQSRLVPRQLPLHKGAFGGRFANRPYGVAQPSRRAGVVAPYDAAQPGRHVLRGGDVLSLSQPYG